MREVLDFEDLIDHATRAARAGQKDRARTLLTRAARRRPDDERPWLWLAEVAEIQEEALGYLRKAAAAAPDSEHIADQLDALEAMSDQGDAWRCPICAAFAVIKPLRCPTCRAVVGLADFAAFEAGPEADRALLESMLEAHSEPREGVEEVQRRRAMALCLFNLGHFAEALEHLEFVAEKSPGDVLLRAHVGELRRCVGQRNSENPVLNSGRRVDSGGEVKASTVSTASSFEGREFKRFVLVVDDSPTLCKLIDLALSERGIGVLVCADGVEALEVIEEFRPDLVLMDVSMPHLDGFGLCRAIRARELTRDLAIIMLTSKGLYLDKIQGRALGTIDYLVKPIQASELIAKVEAVLFGEASRGISDREPLKRLASRG